MIMRNFQIKPSATKVLIEIHFRHAESYIFQLEKEIKNSPSSTRTLSSTKQLNEQFYLIEIKSESKKRAHVQKSAISKKSTFFVL